VQEERKKYQELLEEELNQDRVEHGKKPLLKKPETVWKEVKQSSTDPDSGWFVKNEKRADVCVVKINVKIPNIIG